MPQLDFANPLTLSQVAWMFVIFGVLYLLLARWALPTVARVVDDRAARVSADLEAAREAKLAADAAIRELTEASRRAHAEAQTQIAEAIAAAKHAATEQAREDNRSLDAQIAAAEARIADAAATARGALSEIAAGTADALVQRLTGRPAAPDALKRAVAAAVAG